MTLAVHTAGEGPAVVWLHGYTMDSSTWAALWEKLPGWRHVGVDLPGHGTSPPLEAGTSLPTLASAVAEVARSHGAVRMVALSFGTIVAMQVALDHPDTCAQLVLAAPALGGGRTEPGADVRYREVMRLFAQRAPRTELADAWMQSPPDIFTGTETRPVLRFRLRSVIARHRWTELVSGALAELTRHPHTDADLARLQPRVQVLLGDQDMPVTSEVAHRIASVAPAARLDVLPGTGHLCLLEDPAQAAPLIAAHLS